MIPLEILSHYSKHSIGTGFCKLLEYFAQVSLAANIFCIVLISMDRERSILKPFAPKQSMRRCGVSIGIVGLISFAYSIRSVFLYDITHVLHLHNGLWTTYTYCAIPENHIDSYKTVIIVDFFVVYLIPLFIILFNYGRIAHKLWRERYGNVVGALHTSRRKRKVVRMLLIIIILFVMCQLPLHLYKIYKYWVGLFPGFLIVYQVCDMISFSNSWLNVIAYVFSNDNFNRELKKVLRKRCPCFFRTRVQARRQGQGHNQSVWTVDRKEAEELAAAGDPQGLSLTAGSPRPAPKRRELSKWSSHIISSSYE